MRKYSPGMSFTSWSKFSKFTLFDFKLVKTCICIYVRNKTGEKHSMSLKIRELGDFEKIGLNTGDPGKYGRVCHPTSRPNFKEFLNLWI
ncbi:hypothetical protein C0J52_01621 [Blattella germanica]|nr:hypothetical protein C0J52_01621 [Blattella germanica]